MPERMTAILRMQRAASTAEYGWLAAVARDLETLIILERELRAALEAAEAQVRDLTLHCERLHHDLEREREVSRYYANRLLEKVTHETPPYIGQK